MSHHTYYFGFFIHYYVMDLLFILIFLRRECVNVWCVWMWLSSLWPLYWWELHWWEMMIRHLTWCIILEITWLPMATRSIKILTISKSRHHSSSSSWVVELCFLSAYGIFTCGFTLAVWNSSENQNLLHFYSSFCLSPYFS